MDGRLLVNCCVGSGYDTNVAVFGHGSRKPKDYCYDTGVVGLTWMSCVGSRRDSEPQVQVGWLAVDGPGMPKTEAHLPAETSPARALAAAQMTDRMAAVRRRLALARALRAVAEGRWAANPFGIGRLLDPGDAPVVL